MLKIIRRIIFHYPMVPVYWFSYQIGIIAGLLEYPYQNGKHKARFVYDRMKGK